MLEIAHTGSLTDTASTHRARDGEGGRMQKDGVRHGPEYKVITVVEQYIC